MRRPFILAVLIALVGLSIPAEAVKKVYKPWFAPAPGGSK